MRTAFALAAPAALILTACAGAAPDDPSPPCAAPSATIAYVLDANPGARVLGHVAGDRMPAFLRALNELPPPTDWIADEALIFERPDGPTVLVVLFEAGCAVLHTQMPRDAAVLLLAPAGMSL